MAAEAGATAVHRLRSLDQCQGVCLNLKNKQLVARLRRFRPSQTPHGGGGGLRTESTAYGPWVVTNMPTWT
jgi:hypothetical protein